MIASPCVNLCAYDRQRGLCTGCGRTLGEIADWGEATDGEKRRIAAMAAIRLGASPPRTL